MEMIPYGHIALGWPELLLWIALGVGWVIIQIINKAARGKTPPQKSFQTDESKETGLDDFLSDMVERGEESSEPEPFQPVISAQPQQQEPAPVFPQPVVRPAPVRAQAPRKKKPDVKAVPELRSGERPAQALLFPVTSVVSGRRRARPSALIDFLKSSATKRHAIVYRDILGPPKALRKEDFFTIGKGE